MSAEESVSTVTDVKPEIQSDEENTDKDASKSPRLVTVLLYTCKSTEFVTY